MSKKIYKILSLLLCLCLVFEQAGFAQSIGQLDISGYLTSRNNIPQDKFRPLHLRYLSYDTINNNFNLLVDKGNNLAIEKTSLEDSVKSLMDYFFIGLSLPNEGFWVNLRPDAEANIIDGELAKTDIGRIMLEADVQLKKDTARYTSPNTPEGKEYWEKLYKKAGEIFGYDNVQIPTLTRPWIVPDEILLGETKDGAYIFKATLKVMLEQDYLKDSAVYNFNDERLRALNEYSSQLIRELIIPKITQEVNSAKRYAPLRQVYYSLILAQWFKAKFCSEKNPYSSLIDRTNLNGLTSKSSWSTTSYFKEYQKSFKNGEYNTSESIYTPYGQTIRTYSSGGIKLVASSSPTNNAFSTDTIPDTNLVRLRYDGNTGQALALTKILLINIVDKEKVPLNYPVGLYTLKTYMQNNYPDQCMVEIRDTQLDTLDDIIEFIREWGPQIAGLSVNTENTHILDQFMHQIATVMPKEAKPLCVIGKQVATFGYQDLLTRYPETVCVMGEGELALAGLSQFIQGKRNLQDIGNIAYIDKETGTFRQNKRALLPNFESIGIVDYSDLERYIKIGGNAWMESSRGCPWGACTFCSVKMFWGDGRQRREKPVDMIIAELKQLASMGIKRVMLTDEEFIGFGIEGVNRARKIAQAIIDSGKKIPFYTNMRTDSIWNKEDTPEERQLRIDTLQLLKEAGLVMIYIGIETGSLTQLKRYNKGSDIQTAEEAIKICEKLGINMALGFIIIEPLVSKDEILESIAFIRRNKILPYLSVPLNKLRIYPGEPYIKLIRMEEARLGRRLISDKLDRETLTYETEDYKQPVVKVIVDLVMRYAESEYDLYNAIRWFERFTSRISGVSQMGDYAYLKVAVETSREYQIGFLYQLSSLTDEELLQTQRPQQIFTESIAKRDKFIRQLETEILQRGHARECDAILQQIKKYFEDNPSSTTEEPPKIGPTGSQGDTSSPLTPKQQGPGGIDFRNLPLLTQAINNLGTGISSIPNFDLYSEWKEIKQLVQSGITPSGERIKEYLQVSCYRGKITENKKRVIACISDILRNQEEHRIPTDPILRDILVVLESNRSAEDFRTIFIIKPSIAK